jgi:FkbM family methyltransferase
MRGDMASATFDATTDATTPMKQFRCPNGLRVWNAPESGDDTHFIYTEIFEQHCYERHGVTVRDGDVILDVGANVGLFALSVMERFRGVKMVCLEPVPNIRACLERNVTESPWRNHHEITILACAVGSTNGEATITYFPRAPGNSTMHLGDKRREWATIVDEITFSQLWKVNKLFAFLLLLVFPWRRRVFTRFVAPVFDNIVSVRCVVRTLSDAMRQQGLEHVDLLKIDVEGAELEALEGIEEQHWPRIQQLAMEVAPAHKGALTALGDRLRALGFTKVAVESMLGGTAVLDDPTACTLYAIRAPR